MSSITSFLLGFGLLGVALITWVSTEEKTPVPPNALRTLPALLFYAWSFAGGCYLSVVIVSLIWRWPLPGLR